jgi:beta-glucosidase
LLVDGKTIEQDWSEHAARPNTAPIRLEAGKAYHVEVDFFQRAGESSVSLVWALPGFENFSDSVALARRSDAVVMVLGISGEIENEEHDRTSIDLPGIQQRLLKAVLATGKPVVVVLESGSCIALDPTPLRGLVEAWYPGQAGGTAIAEVLFGKTDPSGRLPVTFYRSLAQVPPFEDYRMKGRTYRYLSSDPLFPFGYGLSYTRFSYDHLKIARTSGGDLRATVRIHNVGAVPGDEVVQAYSSRSGAAWPEPLRKLVAFARVHLEPGTGRTVVLHIKRDSIAQADGEGHLSVLKGLYTISVGGGQPGAVHGSSGRPAAAKIGL